MQAICRNYLRGFSEIKNCRNPQQKTTTTFLAAMKVFSYLLVPLPIAALAILATYKIFSKKPPNGETAEKTADVARQTFSEQGGVNKGVEGTNHDLSTGVGTPLNTATTTTTSTATTTPAKPVPSTPPPPSSPSPFNLPPLILPSASNPNPQSVPKPAQQQTPAVQVTPPTAEELRQISIEETVRIAQGHRVPITINLISDKLVNYRKDDKLVRLGLGKLFDLYEIRLGRLDRDLNQPVTHIFGEDEEGYAIVVPLNNIQSVKEKIA